jgi:hypothetical protein
MRRIKAEEGWQREYQRVGTGLLGGRALMPEVGIRLFSQTSLLVRSPWA